MPNACPKRESSGDSRESPQLDIREIDHSPDCTCRSSEAEWDLNCPKGRIVHKVISLLRRKPSAGSTLSEYETAQRLASIFIKRYGFDKPYNKSLLNDRAFTSLSKKPLVFGTKHKRAANRANLPDDEA